MEEVTHTMSGNQFPCSVHSVPWPRPQWPQGVRLPGGHGARSDSTPCGTNSGRRAANGLACSLPPRLSLFGLLPRPKTKKGYSCSWGM